MIRSSHKSNLRSMAIVSTCMLLAVASASFFAGFCFAADAQEKKDTEGKKRKNAELTEAEEECVKAINQVRKKNDLKPLKVNASFVGVSREFAAEMAERKEAADGFDGKSGSERIQSVGLAVGRWGVTNGKGRIKSVVKEWADSPIAKENILQENVTQLGIGIAQDSDGETYIAVHYVEIVE